MKIQYISDLHLEFSPELISQTKISPQADIFVLVGDISCSPDDIRELFKYLRRQTNIPILYVPGNHEFYGHNIQEVESEYKLICNKYNVCYMNNNCEVFIKESIAFIGAPLYSNLTNPLHAINVQNGLNDFRTVSFGEFNTPLNVQYWNELHFNSIAFIEKCLHNYNRYKTVVITHFAPLINLNSHSNSLISAGFVSNLEHLFFAYNINAWIYGHTHDPIDLEVNNCKIVSNQYGYPGEHWLHLETKIIEI